MDIALLEESGWKTFATDGHTGLIGPFWTRGERRDREIGLIAEPRHCNAHLGTVHGGVLMTFSDVGMGLRVVDELGAPKCATTDLKIQFISAGKVGEFLVCRPEVMRSTQSMVFMRGTICVDERIVAAMNGIWRVL